MSNRPSKPLFATINVTGFCNLSCKYCFYQPRSFEHMTLSAFIKVIDELFELEVFFVNLSGGEPFTHPEINRFLKYAHKRFNHVVLLTNGTILLPSHIKTIDSIIQAKGTFPIQISIDSIQPDINIITRSKPDITLRNIKRLSEVGANIVIAMVVNHFNYSSVIPSIIELSKITNFFHIMRVQSVKALNGADDKYMLSDSEFTEIMGQVKSLRLEYGLHIDLPTDNDGEIGCASGAPCMAAFSHIVIDPSLKVRPCDRLVNTVIGDLNISTMLEIWNGSRAQPILNSPVPYCRINAYSAV